jgi:hypothetical protein
VVIEELSERLPGLRHAPGQTLRFQPNTTFRWPLSTLVELLRQAFLPDVSANRVRPGAFDINGGNEFREVSESETRSWRRVIYAKTELDFRSNCLLYS